MDNTLYIKMEKSAEVTKSSVTIADIAIIKCTDKVKTDNINKINILTIEDDKEAKRVRYLISIMKVIELINNHYPEIEIVNIGETDCVIEKKMKTKNNNLGEIIKVVVICLVLFCGAGFSIMAFNNDIGVKDMFKEINDYLGGEKGTLEVLKLTYSLGISIGIVLFYNHFGPKKLSKDPTPIEVEMRDYESSIYDTLIEGYNRNDGRLDVK